MKNCDKVWLYNGLKKYADVKIIPVFTTKTYFRISLIMPKIRFGEVLVYFLTFLRSIIAIFLSSKNDIIVTWSNTQGFMIESLCRRLRIKRKIVSFMWIRVPNKCIDMFKKSFENENFMPIVNNKNLETEFKEVFRLEKWNGFFLPDVFDEMDGFKKPIYRSKKYIFAGGFNNRDWDVLLKVVKETPNMDYIIVCDKNAIKDGVRLPNLTIDEKIPIEKYHTLMSEAFVTICPLKENTTSGLINILKSAQFGIPCISTRLDVTAMYYSDSMGKLLYNRNDEKDLKKKILYLYSRGEKEYSEIEFSVLIWPRVRSSKRLFLS